MTLDVYRGRKTTMQQHQLILFKGSNVNLQSAHTPSDGFTNDSEYIATLDNFMELFISAKHFTRWGCKM